MNQAFDRLVTDVATACLHNSGTFGLVRTPATEKVPYVLVAGHHQATELQNGFLVSLGLTRDQVEHLRDVCNSLLDGKE